jgi:2-C-methyl-D-erythritol 4-phosphate cytidylyltransferase
MQEQFAAIILASDDARNNHSMRGEHMLWTMLAGRILLARTLDVFEASPLTSAIILVVDAAHMNAAQTLCQQEPWRKVTSIVVGGPRRQDCVRTGLDTLAMRDSQCRWVLVHDGARPLLPQTLLEAGLHAVQAHQAVSAAVPVKETIKQVEQGHIRATPDRSLLWMIQTPQIFSFPLLYQAHHSPLAQEDVSDDADLVERCGQHVTIFPGSYSNIKITTPEDFLLAEALIQENTL